ncbi:MAG TPA: phage virion morphogenesis protein [Pirellulaceae bacterium]|nr:phage virion morphogenesis protein [Pirellulaceae bacterium]
MTHTPTQIRVDNLPALSRLFADVRQFGQDPSELLGIWGATLDASVRSRFDRGVGPGGIPWPISHRAAAQGGKTLVDKGNLEGSLRFEVRPGELEIGFDGMGASSKHARTHQFGAVIVPKNGPGLRFKLPDGSFRFARKVTIPARPMLGIDEDDRRDMREVAIEHLRSLTNGRP